MVFANGVPVETILVLIAALFALTLVSFAMARRSSQKAAGVAAELRAQLVRLRDQEDLPDTLEALIRELDTLSARIGRHLDTRFVRLEATVLEAEQRITRLEIGHPAPSASLPAAATPSASSPSTTASAPPAQASLEPPPARHTPSVQRVYELADAGETPLDIAEKLGMSVGEVEVMLNLRQLR